MYLKDMMLIVSGKIGKLRAKRSVINIPFMPPSKLKIIFENEEFLSHDLHSQ
jgi:hypothetical protein